MNMAICNAGGAKLNTEMERVARLFLLLVTSVASSLALPWEGVTGMGKAPSNGKALWVSCVCRKAAHTQEGTSFGSWGEAYQGLVALCLLVSGLEGCAAVYW